MSAPAAGTGRSDRAFWIGSSILGGSYIVLILSLVAADLFFTAPENLLYALHSKEIRYSIRLSLLSCTTTTILALWVAVPLGYLLARRSFPGKEAVDTILDIPIVLPPMVIGFSLLIFFRTSPGQAIEAVTNGHLGFVATYVAAPILAASIHVWAPRRRVRFTLNGKIDPVVDNGLQRPNGWLTVVWRSRWFWAAAVAAATIAILALTGLGDVCAGFLQERFGTPIAFAAPSVVLAQFSVATAFAARTMRVTFDQISPRAEHVALTLGCSRSQAFWQVALPEARRGLMTAATLAWARSLGEFGPILIFSGATRMRTEVLSTTVWLEMNAGNLHAAIAVSLLMVIVAMIVLVAARMFGLRGAGML